MTEALVVWQPKKDGWRLTRGHGDAVTRRVLNPHSAPPTVTIGFFGFLLTIEAVFYTIMGKFWIAIANPKSSNVQNS
jgi:hypothetical protein